MPKCTYQECVLQEISIFSLRRQGERNTHYYYKHTRTEIAPIDAEGNINQDQAVGLDPDNPTAVDPQVADLIQAGEQALGTTLAELLGVISPGVGYSRHGFGCADECDCEKIQSFRLPDGRDVENPGHIAESGPAPKANAVPGDDQPTAVVEKRVTIPGRGTFLLTYEIRLYGSVRRYKGRCKPRS